MRGHGLKIHDTIFSWAFFAEPALLVPVVIYLLAIKPILWGYWLMICLASLGILILEAWKLRV
jgi:hypothetical protein